jgi:prepilin-type N-terminal cleavage/methylation domain-containing protein
MVYNHPMDRSSKGFTLIELLVVISIIGLLSSVVMASLTTARDKARDARRLSDIEQLRNAFILYQSDHGGALPNPSALRCSFSTNDWYCLGAGDSGTCWKYPTYHGCTALDNAILPYIKSIPDDPENNTAYFGDAYTYNYQSWNASQIVLHWGMSKSPLTSSDCMGGTVGRWDSNGRNRYYCILDISK